MIQTNLQSETISGYFGLTPRRHSEIEKQFDATRKIQKDVVLKDLMDSLGDPGLELGYHRLPVIDAYMAIAKTANEQVYCAFRVANEIEYFTDLMHMATEMAMAKTLSKQPK